MNRIRVLYVEDEPFLGRIVKESLESRGFEVCMVNDGGEAFSTFQREKPDICVLDVMLPHQDGYTIAREIRKVNPHIPVIFVTAKIQTEDLIEGFQSGGNDYIRKPFSMEELIVRIQNLMKITGPGASGSGTSQRMGQFEFFPARFELKGPDGVRKLSAREASLLKLLTESPNKTVQRKEILLKLWGDDSFFNSRNLDVYITKLREYFRADPTVEIVTIKGVGYHFIPGRRNACG